jgi:hypothetical protein
MYLSTWKALKPVTNGEALEQMDVPFGPHRGEILWRLRAAWLDGEVTSEEDEMRLVEEMTKEERGKK